MDQQNEGKIRNKMASGKRKLKIEQTEEIKKRPNTKSLRRGLPAELIGEMFAGLHLEIAFGLFTGMPNALLARNVQKMLKSIKMALKTNKRDVANGRSKMIISDNSLVAKHDGSFRMYFVRAILPMPKFNFNAKSILYFEVKILEKNSFWDDGIFIGFCINRSMPIGIWIGKMDKTFRIWYRKSEESFIEFKNVDKYFQAGDVLGLGIIHFGTNSPMMECFATSNGQLLGMTKLPNTFSTYQFFPAVNLCYEVIQQSVRILARRNVFLIPTPEQLRLGNWNKCQ